MPSQLVESIMQDLRYRFRTLGRTPAFTIAAVAALALGIGATTAIFSVVDAVLLRPLDYGRANALVTILHRRTAPVSPANFMDWRRGSASFERMGAAEAWSPSVVAADGAAEPGAEQVRGLRVSSDLLPLLEVQPALGRLFLPEEDAPGRDRVVILGHGLWTRRFGAAPDVLGRTLTLNGNPYVVIGVMPARFAFPPFWATGAELWVPLALGEREQNRDAQSLRVFGRLAPGVSLRAASAEVAALTATLEGQYPGTNRDVTITPLRDIVVGDVRPTLLVLLAAVGFVLSIACANVAHMLLARAVAREREMTLRTALGANSTRLARQLLTESLLLSFLGGSAGVLLAQSGIAALVRVAPAYIPRLDTIALDARVLAFAILVSLVTGLVFGLAPAWNASRAADLAASLREGVRGSGGRHHPFFRNVLVASEVALALVLLAGAGLMVRSFIALQGVDPGFDQRNVLSLTVAVTGTDQAAPGRRAAFYQELLDRVRSLPGVEQASAINHLPLGGDLWGAPFIIEGRIRPKAGERPSAAYRVVLPGYFETLRIPILRGRDVNGSDRLGSSGVVIVNERLARTHFPNGDAIGRRVTLDAEALAPVWLTIVGIVKDVVQSDWAAPAEDEIYLPYLQTRRLLEGSEPHRTYMTLVIRASGDAAAVAPSVRQAVWSVDNSLTIAQVQTLDHLVHTATAQPRFNSVLLAAFAAAAVLLAGVGIYGVMSYSVSCRTQEIGIRMALGADRAEVLRLVVGRGMLVALAGVAAGIAGALALTRLMASVLYGVGSSDPATFVTVTVLLLGVSLLASYIPARRASRIDPLTAIRGDS